MEQLKLINHRLLEYFGPAKDSDNLPLFRVVWSEGLLEKRHGTFSKFYGRIYLGEWTGVREAKKYSWVKDRWILEVYNGNQKSLNDIKLGDNYEPIWIFNKNNEYQPLYWPAIEHLCRKWIENVTRPESQRRNEKQDAVLEEEKLALEAARIEDYLDISPLQLAFREDVGEAILLPGKEIDWEKN